MSSTVKKTVSRSPTPSPIYPGVRTGDPLGATANLLLRMVIPVALLSIFFVFMYLSRLKAKAKVRSEGAPGAEPAAAPPRSLSARMKDSFASIKTAISTPFTSFGQWRSDQLTLKSAAGQWGSGHGIVTLDERSSVPRTLRSENATIPEADTVEADTIETIAIERPPAAARTTWEQLFRR